jgi:glycosyltransferase involved in cell wall biosynthesis
MAPNMKILYSRTQFWFNLKAGGSVVHTTGVIKGFNKYGSVRVICNEVPYGTDAADCKVIRPFMKNKLHFLFGELLYNTYYSLSFKKEIEDFHPSFTYHRYSRYSYATAKICRAMKVPLVLEFNSFETWKIKYWDKHTNWFTRAVNSIVLYHVIEKIQKYNLNAADLIVTVSEPLKESLMAYGVPGNKILVNPNGVDAEKYRPDINGMNVRQKLGIENKIIIGFIGTFGRWHGAEVLARTIKEVAGEYDNIHFLMVGDGITMPLVKEIIANDNVSDSVTLTGLVPQEESAEYLAACDILASPHVPNPDGTPFFGSPTKLFEYMAMGKAIIASKLDQIGDILQHEANAYLVEPGNLESLVLGLKTLIEDEELRKSLGEAARKEVVNKHTWDEHTRRIVETVNSIIESIKT